MTHELETLGVQAAWPATSPLPSRVSEAGFRKLYESIPLTYLKMNPEGTVLSVNRHGAEQLGYEQDELVGQPVLRVLHEADWPTVSRQFADCVAHPGSVAKSEFRTVRKDGSTLWVQESASAVEEANGETVILVVCEDVTQRKQAEERLLEQQAELRALRTELSLVEERERRRIAVGLHDEIGQNLAFAKIMLSELKDAARSPEARGCTEAIGEHLDEAIRATRTLTFELSSPVLYELGLEAGIRHLVDQMGQQNGVRFNVSSADTLPPLPEDLSIIIYRAAAELLLNVRKHAKCREVQVAIETVGENIHITVRDDGVGFDALDAGNRRSRSGGYGLFNIRERLEQIGGRFEVDSAPGRGTRAVIVAPLERVTLGES